MPEFINNFLINIDGNTKLLMYIIFGVLITASVIGLILKWKCKSEASQKTIINLTQRINSSWLIMLVFFAFFIVGNTALTVLFALISFICLKEFISSTTQNEPNGKILNMLAYAALPLQFFFVWKNCYEAALIFIPVYSFLILPMVSLFQGKMEKFTERSSMIQWGLMICVYSISFVPAILSLNAGDNTNTALLMVFLLIVVQMSDVMQYVFGKICGKHKVAPSISPSKTVEGLVGGSLTAILIGALLHWLTPFGIVYAALVSVIIVIMGFGGGLILSAVKRSIGVKDWGTLIKGHGGVLDRMDSVCFSAPIFFHLTRYFFSA